MFENNIVYVGLGFAALCVGISLALYSLQDT